MNWNRNCYLIMAGIIILTGSTNSIYAKPNVKTDISSGEISEGNKLVEETYSIEILTYNYKNINVDYPEIQGLKDKEREKEINELISNHILLDIIRTDDITHLNELNMELECRITLQSQELLSFYYEGNSNIDGYKPFDEFYSMTLDLINVKEFKLLDFIDIDEALVERLKNSTDVTNQSLKRGLNIKSLLANIQDEDKEWLIESLTEGWYGFILEPDAIVIEVGVIYAFGVYALIKLPGRIVDNKFIFDESASVTENVIHLKYY